MVVAGTQLIEQCGLHLDAQGGTFILLDDDLDLEAPPADEQLDQRLVGQQAVLDDVAHDLPVHGADLVARVHTGGVGRRSGRDSNNRGQGHGVTG